MLQEDQEFLISSKYIELLYKNPDVYISYIGLRQAQATYEEKLKLTTFGTKALFEMEWTVKDLQDLLLEIREIVADFEVLIGKFQDPFCYLVKENVAKKLNGLHQRLANAVKKLSKHPEFLQVMYLLLLLVRENGFASRMLYPFSAFLFGVLRTSASNNCGGNNEKKVAGYFFLRI